MGLQRAKGGERTANAGARTGCRSFPLAVLRPRSSQVPPWINTLPKPRTIPTRPPRTSNANGCASWPSAPRELSASFEVVYLRHAGGGPLGEREHYGHFGAPVANYSLGRNSLRFDPLPPPPGARWPLGQCATGPERLPSCRHATGGVPIGRLRRH